LIPDSFKDAEPSTHSSYERYNETAGAYDRTRTPVGLSILIDCFRGSAIPLKHQRILDAGCGTGSYLYALKDLVGSLVGLDGSRAMLTQAAQKCRSAPNVTLEEGSILKLHFPDHAFDGVMINQVLHHLDAASDFQQLRQCVGEVLRVLKPTGALCINTCSREQIKAQGPIWYYTMFPEAAAFIAPRYIPVHQLCSMLEGAGLVGVSVESRPEECFFAPEQYSDVEGPFREAWRHGDSAFAVYRDKPDILDIRLQELRKSITDRAIYEILAHSERRRERLGQYVVIVARTL
jgi:ubiquinone/menaquinone biosynthesis C-methylase UbiE